MTDCFFCKKGIGFITGGFTSSYLDSKKITIPEGFTDKDRVCMTCMKDLEKGHNLEPVNLELPKGRSLDKIQDRKEEPTPWILTVPIFLGLLGGILGYIALKDHDQRRANDMIIYGMISSVTSTLLLAISYSIILNNSF